MLCVHTAAVNGKWTGRINTNDASRRRHDGASGAREDQLRVRQPGTWAEARLRPDRAGARDVLLVDSGRPKSYTR